MDLVLQLIHGVLITLLLTFSTIISINNKRPLVSNSTICIPCFFTLFTMHAKCMQTACFGLNALLVKINKLKRRRNHAKLDLGWLYSTFLGVFVFVSAISISFARFRSRHMRERACVLRWSVERCISAFMRYLKSNSIIPLRWRWFSIRNRSEHTNTHTHPCTTQILCAGRYRNIE